MPDPWTFVDRYPSLKLSLFESIRFSEHEFKDEDGQLHFKGTLMLEGSLTAVSRFLNDLISIELSGNITEVGEGEQTMPDMVLSAALTGNVTLGSFSFSISLEVANNVIINDKGKPLADPGINLLTTLPIQGQDDLKILARMGANIGHVIFEADIPEGLELGLPVLNRLADNTPIAALLPQQLPVISEFILTNWSIGVAPGESLPDLTVVSVGVTTRDSFQWEIIPGLLAIERISFQFDGVFLANGSERHAQLTGRIRLVENPPVFLELGASFPNFVIDGTFDGGDPIDLTGVGRPQQAIALEGNCIDLRRLAIKFLGETIGGALPNTLEVCALNFEFDPRNSAFSLDGFINTDWTIISIGSKPLITLTTIQMMFRHLANITTGTVSASFRLADPESGPEISVSGTYAGEETQWSFQGQLVSPQISLRELLEFYLPDAKLPPGDVVLNKLEAGFSSGPSKAYNFAVAVVWENIFGGALPLKSIGASLSIESQIKNEQRESKGRIEGTLDFGGFEIIGGFSFDTEAEDFIDLTVFGITAKINTKNPPFILTIRPKGLSFGDVVTLLIRAALAGRKVALPSPWDVLNLLSLDGLEFFINFTDEKIGFTLQLDVNLGFIKLDKISLTYGLQDKSVIFKIEEGSFLGGALPLPEPWDVTKPDQAPTVPGEGSDIFKLKLLAAGQHVLPKDGQLPASVSGAVDLLQAAFKVPARTPPLQDTELRFSNEAGWLIATRATLIGIIDFDAVFYDPLLYGVAIKVTGGNFNNLAFEVLYKKVSDTVGVYQIDLTLPDFIRNQDFGTFSVTLPSIKLSIFTNGNFIIDLGFPTDGDFSRSFGLQWLPFVGSGGFYYGQLNGETATGLPETPCGDFNPAIAFGIGVRVGIGKEINKGILKAGLSLTVQGILEGLIAVFHPYPETNLITGGQNPVVLANDGPATYYFVQGQISLVGRIYGEVNFAIISAELDITARIAVRLTLEAAKAILLEFEAGVTVKLRVTINLGIFKIKVNLSFSATIRERFTIGSDDPNPPWLRCGASLRDPGFRLVRPLDRLNRALMVADLKFQPIEPATPVPMQLYYLPQFTVGHMEEGLKSLGVALLYIEAGDVEQTPLGEPTTPASFEALAEGLFLWTINALFQLADPTVENILALEIQASDLKDIFNFLTRTSSDGLPLQPFSTCKALEFLANYVEATVDIPPLDDGGNLTNAGLFPMFPIFSLQIGEDDPIDFETFEMVDDTYLAEIKAYFQQLAARFRRESQQDIPNSVVLGTNDKQSLANFLFVDYLSMLIRAITEDALDLFARTALPIDSPMSLRQVSQTYARFGLSPERWGMLNRQRPLQTGTALTIRNLKIRIHRGDTPEILAQRLGGISADLFHSSASPEPGTLTRVADFRIETQAGSTLLEVANRFGQPVGELIANNVDTPAIFPAGTRLIAGDIERMTVAEIIEQLQQTHRFQNLSGMAARVYLSGLRPPAPPAEPGDPLGEPTPLYGLSGQQFDASDLAIDTSIQLFLTSEDPLPWLSFGPGFGPTPATSRTEEDNSIHFSFTESIRDYAKGLQSAASSFDPGSSFETFELFDLQQRRVTLRNPITWNRPDPLGTNDDPIDPGIWVFPPELVTLINEPAAMDAKFQLVREVAGDETPVTPIWSTLIPIVIRQAPSGQPDQPVPFVYELQGTDELGGQLLEQLLIRVAADPSLEAAIQILYPESPIAPGDDTPPVGLKSDGADDTTLFLLQTNLSNVANPITLVNTEGPRVTGSHLVGMTGIEFLKFVWEGSVVRSGGYFLFYQAESTQSGLPDFLFNETPSTTVFLLVTTNLETDPAGTALPPYLNTVTTSEQVDPTEELLFVKAVPQTVVGRLMAKDETLADLVKLYRVDAGSIARANATRRLNNRIEINVPATTLANPSGFSHVPGFTYQPLEDDSLASIAFYREVSVTALAFANLHTPGLFSDPLTFNDLLQVKVPLIPPGNVGLELSRPNPDQQNDPAQRQLLELYNWLSYRIAAFGVFPQSNPALPIGPTEPDLNAAFSPDADTRPTQPVAEAPWQFQAVVPVFLDPASKARGLEPENDPYDTVGQKVRLEMTWLDMFGNTIPVIAGPDPDEDSTWPFHDIAIGYIDELVGVDAWPNVVTKYQIGGTEAPQLTLMLNFITNRYEAGGQSDPVQQARSDREQFQTVFFQIKQEDVQIKLATTLEDEQIPTQNFKADILQWLLKIYNFLTEVIENGPPVNPDPISLSLQQEVQATRPKNLFPLAVTFTLQRSLELVNDQFKDVAAVSTAEALITPDIEQPDEGLSADPSPPLRRFADAIEAAFPQIKVLTGSRQADEDTSTQVDIWLARFGPGTISGIQFQIEAEKPFFFAPEPLATTLLSRPDQDHANGVPVFPYVSGQFIGDQTPTTQMVTGIDIEALARDFVVAVDQFLSAQFSVPAWQLQHSPPPNNDDGDPIRAAQSPTPNPVTEPFEAIIQAKADIATAISSDAIAVLEEPKPESGDLSEAREQWRQQLLLQLANAYRIDTSVQYRVAVTADAPPPDREPPRLFGKVVPEIEVAEDGRDAFSFNASSISLDSSEDSAFLSTMVDLKQARLQRNLQVGLNFQLTQIQRNIREVPQIEGYFASSWLTFINPFVVRGSDGPLLEPTIPVPLRAYPTPPSLTEQAGVPVISSFLQARGAVPDQVNDELEKARAWNYTFSYEGLEADQDTVNAIITLNHQPGSNLALADAADPDLLEALVQFNAVFPQIAIDLEALRRGEDNAITRNALTSFAWLVQRTGKAWLDWRIEKETLFQRRSVPLRESAFKFREEGTGSEPLTIIVTRTRATGTPIVFPIIQIAGYQTRTQGTEDEAVYTFEDAQGNLLSAEKGKAIPRREVVVAGFDILKEENAWAGIFVVRNEDLVPQSPTVSDFLYQTPLIRFVDSLTPFLDPNIEIDLASFTPGEEQHALLTFLGNFFEAFFEGAVSVGETRTLAMGSSYEYRLTDDAAIKDTQNGGLRVVLPILLTLPKPFPIEDPGEANPFLQAIAEQIKNWFQDQSPIGIDTHGKLLFDLTVYASLADSQLPVLRLRRLSLETKRLLL